jgi:hypothetical protein
LNSSSEIEQEVVPTLPVPEDAVMHEPVLDPEMDGPSGQSVDFEQVEAEDNLDFRQYRQIMGQDSENVKESMGQKAKICKLVLISLGACS